MDNNWISVEERLPEIGREVLVAFENMPIPVQVYYKGDGIWKGSLEVREFMVDGYCNDERIDNFFKITHWCELPPPPTK